MKLSFVIPTLNFAEFLPHTLDSIVDEGYRPIEIIVFDGGSTDDTLAVLERYRAKFPELQVISATERGNIDIDLNKAVAAATGDYVWTMSADDALIPGWSQAVVAELTESPDLLLVPAIHCDVHMRPRRNYPILKDHGGIPLKMNISGDDDLIDYLTRVRTSEGLFSFCSACLVRRDRLLNTPALAQANGTCWRYSARLIAVLSRYPSTITVMGRPLLYKRGDNDSFSHAGPIRRLKIATLNWDEAIESLGLNPRLTNAMTKFAKSDIRPTTLLFMSQLVRNREEKELYDACVRTRLRDDGQQFLSAVLRYMPRVSLLRRGLQAAKALVRVVQQRLWSATLRSQRQIAEDESKLTAPNAS